METAVNKLEAMFQKAEADLEYIEKQLKFECMTNVPENGGAEENPVKLLENLSAIKVRHKALCTQMEQISVEQKQSVESIKGYLNTTMQLVQELQQTADTEVPPLTEKEKEAAEVLGLSIPQHMAENSPALTHQPAPVQSQDVKTTKFVELSEADFEAVPLRLRSNTKLADLNALYKQLVEHFAAKKNSRPLSLQQMKKMNVNTNEATLKTLQHLSVIELDKKGFARLAERD
ncbi:spindle and kinetochore-associated protein 2 isoform X1 [Conger conger]|uniref:spindle and kinetochore-associated protein 2 isoform X1 n=1 Tax=Conger conger TaxID=82655 RepID=UPI002A59E429|nr:spindle and kinetochore-associated protein 2 isoform X1 [Conger conger]